MSKRFKRLERQYCYLFTKAGYIPYALIRSSRRRSMVIRVEEKGQVCVYVPRYVKDKEINKFIHDKSEWILKNINDAKKDLRYLNSKKFIHGQEFYFLGKKCKLEIFEDNIKRSKIMFDGVKWSIKIPNILNYEERKDGVKSQLIQWYRSQAKEILGCRVFHYSRVLGIEPLNISIRTQKRIWGSCHHGKKRISLNWQLIMSPIEVLDYVVVHELCHLFFPNHSRRFWKKVSSVMPDYLVHQKWLRDHSLEIRLP